MAKNVVCPFCGLTGVRTNEHVWAQWMHATPGAIALLEDTHGERIQPEHSRLHRGGDGRYQHEAVKTRTAKWLPNVKVDVCATCNNGWMSDLETATKKILGPFVLGGAPHIRLSKDDLITLATWATKSWMAYALLRLPHENPFRLEEYRAMAAKPAPLVRTQVWLMHSVDDGAYVSMALDSTLLSSGEVPPDMATAQDNFAYGFLAVATVVLFLQLLPEPHPPGMDVAVAPRALANPRYARQIWPKQRAQFFPLATLHPGGLASLTRWGNGLFNLIGLPTVGLDDEDARGVVREFKEGANPVELRRKWDQG